MLSGLVQVAMLTDSGRPLSCASHLAPSPPAEWTFVDSLHRRNQRCYHSPSLSSTWTDGSFVQASPEHSRTQRLANGYVSSPQPRWSEKLRRWAETDVQLGAMCKTPLSWRGVQWKWAFWGKSGATETPCPSDLSKLTRVHRHRELEIAPTRISCAPTTNSLSFELFVRWVALCSWDCPPVRKLCRQNLQLDCQQAEFERELCQRSNVTTLQRDMIERPQSKSTWSQSTRGVSKCFRSLATANGSPAQSCPSRRYLRVRSLRSIQ